VASEQRGRALLENSFDATVILNAAGNVTYLTPAAQRMLGGNQASASFMETGFAAVVHPDDRPRMLGAHAAVLQAPGHSCQVSNYRLVLPGGDLRWVEAVGTNCLHVPGVEGVVVNIHDITEQTVAFASLARTAELHRRLNEFAGSLSPLHDEDEVLWQITRQCVDLLGFVDCVIYLVAGARGVLVQRAAFGPKNPRAREILNRIEIPLGQGVVGGVAQSGLPALITDTRLEPRYIVDDERRLAEIAVPIIADGQVLGVIDSEHPQAGFFTAEHLTILSSIAAICATKLVRARAEVSLRDVNQQLERRIAARTVEMVQTNEQLKREIGERRRAEQVQRALFEISEAVHAAVDLPSLYARIHAVIGTLMPAENFYLALQDAATGMVNFPYHRDRADPPPPPRTGRRGMTEYVLRTGRAALVGLADIQRLKDAGEYHQSGHPAAIWLGVPLTVEGRTFGVMAVQDAANAEAFGEEEKRILSFVAGQTALAIDRKRAEEQLGARTQRLRESEERFSKAFSAMPSNVSIVRAVDQRFVEVNQALLDYSGFTRAEVIGRTTSELCIWADETQRDEFYRRLRMEGRVLPLEVTLRAKSGRLDTVIIAAEKIDVEGEPHILALSVVITERKQAEEELIRSLARERELSRLKSSFVSLVSHEFRTPIGIIHSSAEILERYFARLSESERQEHLRAIQTHAWRMAVLMEEVLVFGRVEAGRLEFRPTDFDLAERCQRWAEELSLATEHRCPIRVSVGELPRLARGDVDLLAHVVSNLLSNAVKYSPPGRTVEFSIRHEGGVAVFGVADRGLGIPAASRERLFTAFQRGENVRHLPGTGLGLVVIRHCLDLHRGTIELESTENQGTTVTVRVPLYEGIP
jgi:PAS domain S-box-containing protein